MIRKAIVSGKDITFTENAIQSAGTAQAHIFTSSCGSFVMKVIDKNVELWGDDDCYSREVFLLRHIKSHGFDWVPDVLSACDEDKSIVMPYCGEKINKDNAPPDTKEQLYEIIRSLETLNIAHNDIYWRINEAPNILVKEGKIYLCDWGWGSIDNSLTCGGMFNDRPGFLEDKERKPDLEMADKVLAELIPNFWKKYMSADRDSVGSQSERSKVVLSDKACHFEGYQVFTLTKDTVTPGSQHKKYAELSSSLQRLGIDGKSVADVGANNGVVAYMAMTLGASVSYALDHDKECISNITSANKHLDITNVHAVQFDFGDSHDAVKADIVIAMAIIHWVYSCTASFGCLKKIIERLRNLANDYLIIEWVAPDDQAISIFHHTSFNPDVAKEPYTTENFEKAIRDNKCSIIEKIPSDRRSRTTYIIRLENE